ncbi:MAG TPA: TatD family deoxyribonuclease [Crocinitomicaceae bacterium]|nr:TatD family deoxyribonuclease [Crocinitomicaceae bacterium]
MYIDTHTHLYSDTFDDDRTEIVQKAIDSGVELMLLPNIDVDTIDAMHSLVEQFPNNCRAMMGLHPGNVKEDWEDQLQKMKELLFNHPENYLAVGEIGMDLYWDKTFVEEQKKAFAIQVEWAKELKLPIVTHARDAFQEIYKILDELNDDNLRGVFHCFTGTEEDVKRIDGFGNFLLGIGGVLTFKNSGLDEVIKNVSLDKIILETDSPYLPPVPYRGKRNESSYLLHVAEKMADVYGVQLSMIEEATTNNAKKMFNL